MGARPAGARPTSRVDGLAALAPTPKPSLVGRGVLVALFFSLSLAACGSRPSEDATGPVTQVNAADVRSTEAETPRIECAAPGSTEFAPVCTIERAESPDGAVLILRHPDGGFHRLQMTRDGRGVIAADGAEPAKVTLLAADRIQVELGGARYRLPAVVRAQQ